jgi:hypothetical protein
VKAVCKKREIIYLLGENNNNLPWLLDEINKYPDTFISKSTFYRLLGNKSSWPLDYALIISNILNTPIENLFVLK